MMITLFFLLNRLITKERQLPLVDKIPTYRYTVSGINLSYNEIRHYILYQRLIIVGEICFTIELSALILVLLCYAITHLYILK